MERHHRSEISKKYDLPELHSIVQREAWVEKANCRGMNPDIFFPEKGESVRKAKSICNTDPCPVRQECLEYGLKVSDNRNGVYGGMSGVERRVYQRHKNITLWKAS